MSRFALDWAKEQRPANVEAKVLLLILGDEAEGSDSTCTFVESKLADATGIDQVVLPVVIERLKADGYISVTVMPPPSWDPGVARYPGREIKFGLLIPDPGDSWVPHPSIGGDNDDPTAVYRLYDPKGVLLYVGISQYPTIRLKQHQLTQLWWFRVATQEITWHPSESSASAEERRAIKRDHPIYNKTHSPAPPSKGKPPKRRYVKEDTRHNTYVKTIRRMRSDLQAGCFDVGVLPSTSALADRYEVGEMLVDQMCDELLRAGEIAYLPDPKIRRRGVYIRDWSSW